MTTTIRITATATAHAAATRIGADAHWSKRTYGGEATEPQDGRLRDPAGQRGRLLHLRRHLRLVELVALADVDVARVLALAGTGRDRSQRRPAEEGHLDVVREGVDPLPAFGGDLDLVADLRGLLARDVP
jgi:hypothetical protein